MGSFWPLAPAPSWLLADGPSWPLAPGPLDESRLRALIGG
eukprot:CAMPEP_0174728684 /NCGR_PEP_ID=MMETSP1094-20130205/52215_1 /TAXON_ID=156173 /ORGANISM="Chrysochromulina brevifilum, Strain UTEX LB 985" /LENGTH=39 /DNA_ID= /DNA_START= /DNA_END= /DNA_ORIENTATION=